MFASSHRGPWAVSNYPAKWQDEYTRGSYYQVDPVRLYAPLIGSPFFWCWLPRILDLEASEQLVLDHAAAAGLANAVSVPVYCSHGRIAIISYAAGRKARHPGRVLDYLIAVSSQFHVALRQNARHSLATLRKASLSRREIDCLNWVAQGKSSWDTGRILDISGNTVNFHIKNVMRKLDVMSRTAAVVKGIRLGLIDVRTVIPG